VSEKHRVVFDTETYKNYFLAAFKSMKTGQLLTFERTPSSDFNAAKMRGIFRDYQVVGFNSGPYDLPMCWLAMCGASNATLKRVSDKIILGGMKSWMVEREFKIRVPTDIDHIDLMEPAPGVQISLKLYGGRMHSRRLQELPYDPDAVLTPEEMALLKLYCVNDLDVTGDLLNKLMQQVELREQLTEEYGQNLLSKSDAQIAEAVIKAQIEARSGEEVKRPQIAPGTSYSYRVPPYIQYQTPQLQEMLDGVRACRFEVWDNGKVDMPDFLKKAKIKLGSSTYRMGIGGLHSSEKCQAVVADEDTILVDRDVTSYYPAIILTLGLAPQHLGEDFLTIYRGIVDRRIKAKREGNKVVAESLKITVNGSFGKLGSKWSCLYAPDLMTQVTVTGQLALLMLIERMEQAGIPIVSANTDGLVIKCPRAREADMDEIVAGWEHDTNFQTEASNYSALYSRDVNNYIAVKREGGVKCKGAYAPAGLQKNPTNEICVDAAIKCITEGVPVAETIAACQDVRQFLSVRRVNGGALLGERFVGKVVRWYMGSEDEPLRYRTNGNKVPLSDGAIPLMEITDEFPSDLYHWRYVKEAAEICREVGFTGPVDPHLDLL
jgi:hypothetical protein